ncbi:MAG: flagellar basal body-associated FliL family protein [Alphaproteobacteria bacterium]|nr:flagellar basal body-associated FliL family protein [Alphaproteobacteria bacterium]
MTERKDTISEEKQSLYEIAKKSSSFQKKLILTGFSSFVFIVVVISASLYLLSLKSPKTLAKEHSSVSSFDIDFLHTPEINTKLKTDRNKESSLKARFSIQVSSKDAKARVNRKMNLIANKLQKRLAGYSARDLSKKYGIEKVRKELLDKINAITKPVQINQIFIKDFLIH